MRLSDRLAPAVVRRLGSRLRRRASRGLLGQRPRRIGVATPVDPVPLTDFRLFGLIATWMEADIIRATVQNAFLQGCERVFVVDNDSPDDTVEEALAAGAELAATERRVLSSAERMPSLNRLVHRISRHAESEHIWWLWMDADEFCHGPRGLTVLDYLRELDRRFRLVGAHVYNHYPSSKPEYVPGRHPLDYQPLCEWREGRCPVDGHWKHPLQRWDRGGPRIMNRPGAHRAEARRTVLLEPMDAIFMHHFQYRDETITRHRLQALMQRLSDRDDAQPDARVRARFLDSVYQRRWDEVPKATPRGREVGVHPVHWVEAIGAEHREVDRWYSDPDPEVIAAPE